MGMETFLESVYDIAKYHFEITQLFVLPIDNWMYKSPTQA